MTSDVSARTGADRLDGIPVVAAAGTVPWRRRGGALEVAVIHRPKYDDWSWPKGKLDRGEDWPVAAVRETCEETGLRVRLGRPLPATRYRVLDRSKGPAVKQVRYWAAQVVGGSGRLEHEVDDLVWLDIAQAGERLDYPHDRDQLRAVADALDTGGLRTWPLAVVRHAKALPRSDWSKRDTLRPLDARGQARAQELVPLLEAYGVRSLVSSSSTRCAQTLRPYAAAARLPISLHRALSEEGYESHPLRARRWIHKLFRRGEPVAVSGHGPVLPAMLEELAGHIDPIASRVTRELVDSVAADGMAKGEVLVAHVVGVGRDGRVVAAERYGVSGPWSGSV